MLELGDSKNRRALRTANPKSGRRHARKARAVLDRPPPLQGWRTTDEDEIALRRWRGRTEIVAIEALEPKHPFFGTFRVQSGSGGFYEVEIRRPRRLQQFLRLHRSSRRTASGPASTSRACSRLCASAAPERSARPRPGAVRASRCSWIVAWRRNAGIDVARGRPPPCERGAPLARCVP